MYALSVGTIAAAIGIAASFKVLNVLFPAKAIMPAQTSFVELKTKYRKWTTCLGLLMLLVAAPLAFGFWYALQGLATWHAAQLPQADVTFAPIAPPYWALPAILLGAVCGGVAAIWAVRRLLGKRYNEFLAYWSLSGRADPIKSNIRVYQVCTIACLGLIVVGLHTHVQLVGDTLIVDGLVPGGEVRYALADIESIRTSAQFTAPNGNLVSRREYLVTFSGGRSFATSLIPSAADQNAKRQFIALLSERSGKPIQEVALFAKGEL